MTFETRFVPLASSELRTSESGKLSAYGAVFNSYSQNLGGFVEQIDPKAFNRTLGEQRDVLSMFNHDPNMLLGSTSSKTLSISVDDRGLRYTLTPPNTTAGRDVTELATAGILKGSSFTFRCNEDSWGVTDEGFPLRSVLSADLFELGPVSSPAYLGTTEGDAAVALRSLAKMTDRSLDVILAASKAGELRDILRPSVLPVVRRGALVAFARGVQKRAVDEAAEAATVEQIEVLVAQLIQGEAQEIIDGGEAVMALSALVSILYDLDRYETVDEYEDSLTADPSADMLGAMPGDRSLSVDGVTRGEPAAPAAPSVLSTYQRRVSLMERSAPRR